MKRVSDNIEKAIRVLVPHLRHLHPEICAEEQVIDACSKCFASSELPNDNPTLRLASAVIEHIGYIRENVGSCCSLSLLPLGLGLYVELEVEGRDGCVGLPFLTECLYEQALGQLPGGFINVALEAARRVAIEEDGYSPETEIAVLMGIGAGADVILRDVRELEGIRGRPILDVMVCYEKGALDRQGLYSVLSDYYVTKEDIDVVMEFLMSKMSED